MKTRLIRLSVFSLFWIAVSAALVFSAGQGWKALAVVSLPIFGFFGTALLALYFGPFAKADQAAPSAEEPEEPTA